MAVKKNASKYISVQLYANHLFCSNRHNGTLSAAGQSVLEGLISQTTGISGEDKVCGKQRLLLARTNVCY